MGELKNRVGQETLGEIVYEIMDVLAKHRLTIRESKTVLDMTKNELENVVPWTNSQ